MTDPLIVRRKLNKMIEYLGQLEEVNQYTAEEIAPSAGLRNRLVHEYEEIDDQIVYQSIQKTLASYKKYIKIIENYLKNIENSSH